MAQVFTIDNGNSNPNIGIFTEGVLVDVLLKDAFLTRYTQGPPADSIAVMADVGKPNELPDFFGDKLVRLGAYRDETAFLDMPVNYGPTLGEDRLALAYHVYKTMPNALPALIIDSGTFATVDVVDGGGFVGGYIFPGMRRFYEIYGKSARLPDLSGMEPPPYTANLPHATDDAILQAGALYWRGILREVLDGPAKNIKSVVLTGGSALILEKILRELFPNYEYIVDLKLMHLSLYTVFRVVTALSETNRPI